MNRVLTRTEKVILDSRSRIIQRAFRSTHANIARRGSRARVIQRALRSSQERSSEGTQARSSVDANMALCASPHDRALDLKDK